MARSNAIGKMREIAESKLNIKNPRLAHFRSLSPAYEKRPLRWFRNNVLRDELRVQHSQILVMGYIPPARSKGGILFTDTRVEEDRWQGNAGLVVALGPGAYKDCGVAEFHGEKIEVGVWVVYVAADGISLFIREVPCRLFQDTRILMKVQNPEIYY